MTCDTQPKLTGAPRRLAETIARAFCVPVEAMLSRSRRGPVAVARQAFIHSLALGDDRGGRRRSTTVVGALLDLDHTTVVYAMTRTRQRRAAARRAGHAPGFSPAEEASAVAVHLGIVEADVARAWLATLAGATGGRIPVPCDAGQDSFGRLGPRALADLPRAMRRDGLLLAMERKAADTGLPARPGPVAARLGLDGPAVATLLASRERHALPGEQALRHRDALPERILVPARPPGAFRAFAAAHLRVGEGLSVEAAYHAFLAFARRNALEASPRAQFGHDLLVMARLSGGSRQGDRLVGLALVAAPQAVPPPFLPAPAPPRAKVPRAPLRLGWTPNRRRLLEVD